MRDVADQSAAPTTIRADLCAISVSLELSRSIWNMATSLSRQAGGIARWASTAQSAGDAAALLARFSRAQEESVRADRKILRNRRHSRSGLDGLTGFTVSC